MHLARGRCDELAGRTDASRRGHPAGGPAELRREGAVDELLARLWWDAHVGGPDALAVLVAAQGTDRLVGGTNFAGWDQTADPSFGDRALGDVLDDNARRLLRLGR